MAETTATTTTTTGVALPAEVTKVMGDAETFIKAYPLPAVLAALILGGMFLGEKRRR